MENATNNGIAPLGVSLCDTYRGLRVDPPLKHLLPLQVTSSPTEQWAWCQCSPVAKSGNGCTISAPQSRLSVTVTVLVFISGGVALPVLTLHLSGSSYFSAFLPSPLCSLSLCATLPGSAAAAVGSPPWWLYRAEDCADMSSKARA